MGFFSFSPVLIWFLAGIVFLGLELLLPGLVVFFFGVGALSTALIIYFLPMELANQLLVFLSTSLVALALLRSTLKKVFLGRKGEVDAMDAKIPDGVTGTVIEDIIPPSAGKIKYAGSFWLAVADTPIKKGTVVRIIEKNNLSIKVGIAATNGES